MSETEADRVGAERVAAAERVVGAACEYIDAWLADEGCFLPPSYAPLHPLFDAVMAYQALSSGTDTLRGPT